MTSLTLISPSSVTTSGGTASITTNGLVEFQSASAIVLNNVFNSTYDDYLVLIYVDDGDCVNENFHFQLTSSGSAANTNYYSQITTAAGTGVVNTARFGPQDAWRVIAGSTSASSNAGACYMTIHGPAEAQDTTAVRLEGSGEGGAFMRIAAHSHDSSTSYDGLRFFYGPLNNAPTYGNISVYGMPK